MAPPNTGEEPEQTAPICVFLLLVLLLHRLNYPRTAWKSKARRMLPSGGCRFRLCTQEHEATGLRTASGCAVKCLSNALDLAGIFFQKWVSYMMVSNRVLLLRPHRQMGWDAVQLVERSPTIHKALGSNSKPQNKTSVEVCTEDRGRGNRKFKVILSYTMFEANLQYMKTCLNMYLFRGR